jgi:lipoprotein-anchoring transpeptidase ErfK/SrfK
MISQGILWSVGLAATLALASGGAGAQTSGGGAAAWPSDPAAAVQTDDPAAAATVDHSEPASAGNGGPKVMINVDLTMQQMNVRFADGTTVTWPISSGRPGLDTPDGRYKPQWVDPDHISKQYQDAPMPYAIFFDLQGHAFHGSYQKTFGVAVSHGCVRLPVDDAKTLYDAVKISGAEIVITGKAHSGRSTAAANRGTSKKWARRHMPGSSLASRNPYGAGSEYPYGVQGGYTYGSTPQPHSPPPPYSPPQTFFRWGSN